MAKKFSPDSHFEVEEIIEVLSENDKNNWGKAVARISWNDRPSTLDIRNMNLADPAKTWPKGISLSDEEADRLTDVLLDRDYGSIESMSKALKRKQSRFTVLEEATDCFSDDEMIVIGVNL